MTSSSGREEAVALSPENGSHLEKHTPTSIECKLNEEYNVEKNNVLNSAHVPAGPLNKNDKRSVSIPHNYRVDL